MKRSWEIIKISGYGIIANFVLAFFKALIGFITGSIAITLDAVNNLSDALSSMITILGTSLASKRPDKKHPYGYGRIEYLTSVAIALMIFFAGFTALKESLSKIIKPEETTYTYFSIGIILLTVFVKYFFGKWVERKGEKLQSGSLIASGKDAKNDAILSFTTVLGGVVKIWFHIQIEGYLGFLISIFILKVAYEIIRETAGEVIGRRADPKLVRELKEQVMGFSEVVGVYDISLHSYGPNKTIGTLHVQVDDEMTAREIHKLTRRISKKIFDKLGIILTVGIYASNEKGEFEEVWKDVSMLVKQYPVIKQIHGFYVDEEEKTISFDLIFDFEEKKPERIVKTIQRKLKEKYPDFESSIVIDQDISG